MDENLNKNNNFSERIKVFFKKNKFKILLFVFFIFLILITIALLNANAKKNNILISEKYIKAGLLLSKNKNENAKDYYEEIVLSENKFYSLLALNTLIEKDLINDQKKIIKYFEKLENLNLSKDLTDLILIKKALYLKKIKDNKSGKNILNKLIKDGSNLKSLAEDLIN